MNRCLTFLTLFVLLLCSSWAIAEESAQPPSLRTLIDGVPILTPKTKSLQRFHLQMDSQGEEGAFPQRVEMYWVRDQWSGMYVTMSKHGTPLVFTSQGRGFQFDTIGRRVMLHDGDSFKLTGKVHEENFQVGYGISSDQQKEAILFDLPSLVQIRSVTAKIERDGAGDWQVSAISGTGRSRVILAFDGEPPHSLKRYEAYSLITGKLKARLDLSLNKDFPNTWPKFPADDAFPEGLEVCKLDWDFEEEDLKGKMSKMLDIMVCLMAQMGVGVKEIRESKLMADKDWEAIEATDREYGPKLLEAIGLTPQKLARQEGGPDNEARRY